MRVPEILHDYVRGRADHGMFESMFCRHLRLRQGTGRRQPECFLHEADFFMFLFLVTVCVMPSKQMLQGIIMFKPF